MGLGGDRGDQFISSMKNCENVPFPNIFAHDRLNLSLSSNTGILVLQLFDESVFSEFQSFNGYACKRSRLLVTFLMKIGVRETTGGGRGGCTHHNPNLVCQF